MNKWDSQEDCLDCHLPESSSEMDHRFEGPLAPGFLDGVAKVGVFLRREETHGSTALVQISHKAGHALPGGTTGRSVWLMVRGLGADGEQVWRETVRFGWEHHPDRGWVDRTLPPGRPAVLELREPARERAVKLSAELIYWFRPGRLDEPDPRAVVLDALELVVAGIGSGAHGCSWSGWGIFVARFRQTRTLVIKPQVMT